MRKRKSDRELAEEIAKTLTNTPSGGLGPVADAQVLIERAVASGDGPMRRECLDLAQREIAKLDPSRHRTTIHRLHSQILALQGRRGDTEVAHVTPGEFVVPREMQTPELWAAIQAAALKAGIDPARLVVGSHRNSINPITGQPEFAGGLLAPPQGPMETIEVTGRRPFSPNDINNAARLIYAEAGNQPYDVKQKVMQSMLSRVGTIDNKQNTLNDVMFAPRPGNSNLPQYEGVTNPRFTKPIPDAGPDKEAWNQSVEIAQNSINDAIQDAVDYGDRFFKNVPGAKPAALKFWDTKPDYDDDINRLPYPKIKR